MNKVYVFVDDERFPEDVIWVNIPKTQDWNILRRAVDFQFMIHMEDCFKDYVISFDHDIDSYDMIGNEITGYDLLKQLCDRIIQCSSELPILYFHSKNIVGKTNMQTYWDNFIKYYKGNLL